MNIAGLETFALVPNVGLLAFTSECSVALGDAIQVALDRVRKAAGVGLNQQPGPNFAWSRSAWLPAPQAPPAGLPLLQFAGPFLR